MKQVEMHWFSLQCSEVQTETSLAKTIMNRNEVTPNLARVFASNWAHIENEDFPTEIIQKCAKIFSNSTTLMSRHHLVSAFDLHWYCTWCKSWLKFSHDAAAASSKKLRCCICQKFRMERNFWISMKCQLCTAIGSKGRWKVFSSTFQQGILSQAW